MDEQNRYAVGVDVGTENVRAVLLDVKSDGCDVIAYGEAKNEGGMQKGVVTSLSSPAAAVDKALGKVEEMSGINVDSAYVSVNGSHIVSVKTEGMITITSGQEIGRDDLERLNQSAMSGRVPGNREILDIIPLNYTLDGQSGIRNPIGMSGVRLEMKATVVSGLTPSCMALEKMMDAAEVHIENMVPTAMAAARAVLTEKQMEIGTCVIDFGASTTSVAVYEEGDLQFVGVINAGSFNITKDLAICLETDTDMAEQIKLKYATADFPEDAAELIGKDIVMKQGKNTVKFNMGDVNAAVGDRLYDIFDHIAKMLKSAGYYQKLAEGAVIVGGGAKIHGLAGFAKNVLKMNVKIGSPEDGLRGSMAEYVEKPEYATAVGLALAMASSSAAAGSKKQDKKSGESLFSRIFKRS